MTAAVAFAFALCSSLSWAGLDATRKLLSTQVSAVALVTVLSAGQIPIYLAWWAADPGTIQSVDYVGPALIEIALNVAANLLFVRAVEVSPLSVTIPFLSFTPVFATAIAIPLLAEFPNPVQYGGIAAVVVGALILGAGEAMRQGRGPFGIVAALVQERGALYMLAVAFFWACTIAIDKAAMKYAALPVHALIQNGAVGVLLFFYLLARGRAAELGAVRKRPIALWCHGPLRGRGLWVAAGRAQGALRGRGRDPQARDRTDRGPGRRTHLVRRADHRREDPGQRGDGGGYRRAHARMTGLISRPRSMPCSSTRHTSPGVSGETPAGVPE